MHKRNEMNKKAQTIKKKKKRLEILELKTTMIQLRNLIVNFNIRQDKAEDRINELKNRSFEIKHSEKHKENKFKNEESLHGLCNTIKRNNLCIIMIPEKEERSRMFTLKIMAENFLILKRDLAIQVNESNLLPQTNCLQDKLQ